jgi:type I restriction enzyme R subunit
LPTAPSPSTSTRSRWLDRIREHLRQNLSIEEDDFEVIPIFSDIGGRGAARRAFGDIRRSTCSSAT